MVLRLLSISIFLVSIILPRNIYFKPNFISSSNLDYVQLPEPIKTNYSLLSRFELDTAIIWADDLEDGIDGWQFNDGWNLTSLDSYSGNHSLLSPNDASTIASASESGNYFSLYSSVFSLPAIPSYEKLFFNFWLNADIPDSNGDDDNYLDDYYYMDIQVSEMILDEGVYGFNFWNISDFQVNSGEYSYWCGSDDIGGYSDGWLQFLDSPNIELNGDQLELSAWMKWNIEDATSLDEVSEGFIDGWDAINVRISNDNGNSWAILESSNDPYDFFSGYGWLHNGETPGQSGVNSLASGWSGDSDWHQVKFDLTEYVDQNVIIRFAFGSDPAYSTYGTDGTDSNPIPSLTGLFIDDIKVSSSGEVLFSANAEVDSEDVMISSGSSWLNWFYGSYGKYCLDNNGNILNVDDENACVAIDGSWFVEPGSEGWEPYYLLDFTPFMGTDIRFRFASVYDDNNDGGSGKGLFFDDFVIYRQNLLSDINVLIDPISFSAESKNGNIHLSWYDVSQSGDSTFVFDNNDSTKFGSILIESQESDEIASAGIVFPAWLGESNIKSIYLYNETDGDKTVSISGYGIQNNEAPSLIEPVFIKEDIVLSNLGWNKILLLDWEFPSLFILSQKFSKATSIPYDPTVESSSLQYLVEDGINWELFPSIGSWCIRSDVEYQGIEGVNYNLFRKVLQSNSESEVQIANNVVGGVFIDTDVENNAIYQYRIEQVFANNIITQDTLSVTVLPKSVYDLPVYDDGSFESELALLENDSIAVFYKNDRNSQSIAQFKWYQNGSGGYFRFLVWDDDNGIPGNLIKSVLMSSISYEKTNGWNIVNLANKNIQVSSDFWIGIEASSDLRPIGLDTSIDLEVSKIKSQNNSWESVGGNIGFQVSLDCNDDCPDSLSLNSVSNPIKYEISQIYPNPFNPNVNIKYKISKLSKVELSIYDLNGRMVNKLVDDILLPGSHTSTWESIGISGKKVSSGVYFVELKVGGNTAGFTKMVLIK